MHGSPNLSHAHASAQNYSPAAAFTQPAIFNGRRTGSMHLGGEPFDDGSQGQGQDHGLGLPGSLRGGPHGHGHGFNSHPHGREPSTPTSQFGTPSLIPDRVANNAMHSSPQLVSRLASQMQPQSPSLHHAPAPAQASPVVGSAVANPWNAGPPESMAMGGRRVPFDLSLPKASNVSVSAADPTPAQSQVQAQAHAAASKTTAIGKLAATTAPGAGDDSPVLTPTTAERKTPGARVGTTKDQQKEQKEQKEHKSSLAAAANGIVPDEWREPHQMNSLTFDNLAQHNQRLGLKPGDTSGGAATADEVVPSPMVAPAAVAEATPAAATPTRRKATAGSMAKPIVTELVSPPAGVAEIHTTGATTKTPWTTAAAPEDKSKTLIGVANLREIQDAESKQASVRKAAEKERLTRASVDDVGVSSNAPKTTTTTTLQWGLPTSQTGPRGGAGTSAAAKEAEAANAAGAAPVWTNASKPGAGKKTMKEIQEEEEKRKKTAAKEKETVAAAAKRAYTDSTVKVGHGIFQQ
jgi:PERQ amino acid-rich with GYF domain-containing protein